MLNLSEKCNYNPNLVWIHKISKIFLCVCKLIIDYENKRILVKISMKIWNVFQCRNGFRLQRLIWNSERIFVLLQIKREIVYTIIYPKVCREIAKHFAAFVRTFVCRCRQSYRKHFLQEIRFYVHIFWNTIFVYPLICAVTLN